MREVLPVALDLFCRGVEGSSSRRLISGAVAAIVLSPMTWPFVLAQRSVNLLIFFVVFWLVRDDLLALRIPDTLVVTIGLVVIFYRDIHREIMDILLNGSVILSGGKLLRWACQGYRQDTVIRQKLMNTKAVERLIASLAAVLPEDYRREYERVLDLYCHSNSPDREHELRKRLEEYWRDTGPLASKDERRGSGLGT